MQSHVFGNTKTVPPWIIQSQSLAGSFIHTRMRLSRLLFTFSRAYCGVREKRSLFFMFHFRNWLLIESKALDTNIDKNSSHCMILLAWNTCTVHHWVASHCFAKQASFCEWRWTAICSGLKHCIFDLRVTRPA